MERACYVGAGDACYELSLLYAEGRGVAKDERRAGALVEQGCRAGGAMACFVMAQRLHDGVSGVRGACCTVGLLLRACVQRLPQACEAAALLCGEGDAVARYREECKDDSFNGCEFVRP
jgi:TPR repeat protein